MKLSHAAIFAVLAASSAAGPAQTTRSAQDTVTAYGSRLLNPADPTTGQNSRRINNRIKSRITNRVSTRIERFAIGATANPAEAYTRAAPTQSQSFERAADAAQQRQED